MSRGFDERLRAGRVCLVLLCCGVFVGCFGSVSDDPDDGPGAGKVEIEFPDGDPSVPADLGGPEFTGGGNWTTVESPAGGSAQATKGGAILTSTPSWPENLRMYGTGSNTFLNSIVESLCFETLLNIDSNTLEFEPGLASHWEISSDNMTFTFRINPRAHWANGQPVTSDDVVATYRLIADETTVDPMSRAAIVEKMEEPEPLSKYMFRVKCKTKDWRNFISLCGMRILPASDIGDLEGSEYLKKYNFELPTVSGPYRLDKRDIKDNESLTLTRRDDYWGIDEPGNQGLYNFDRIRFVVVRDQRKSFEMARKGDLDFYPVYTAQWWVEDLDTEAVRNGWLVKQKVYTKYPSGIQGLAFNTRKAPLGDKKVRLAIAHLYDRKKMVDKFAYGEYDLLKSYFPGGDSENAENEIVEYDPRKAVELLEEAGWTEIGDDGIRRKDGERMSITIAYRTPGLGKYYTTFKEDAKQAGVEVNLDLITPETHWKNQQEHNFQVSSAAWGAILFPNPKSNWHSAMAEEEGSNNITGVANEKIDAIIERYDAEFDAAKRTELLRELDALLYDEHTYALAWYLPCERLLYWNKFGMPETVLPKYGDWRDAFAYWWVDEELKTSLEAARKSGEKMPIPPVELHPWDGEAEATAATN